MKEGRSYSGLAQLLLISIVFIALFSLIGWSTGKLFLAQFSNIYIPMAPSTALAFLVLSTALLVKFKNINIPFVNTIILFLVLLVACFSVLIIARYCFRFSLDLENVFIKNPESINKIPKGRMSPLTGLLIVLESIPIFLYQTKFSKIRNNIYGLVSFFSFFLSSVLLIGYLYNTPFLYGGTIIPVALPTAICFWLLSTSLLIIVKFDFFPFSLLIGTSIAAKLTKTFLPTVVILLILNSYLDSVVLVNLRNTALVSAFVLILAIIVVGFIIIYISKNIGSKLEKVEDDLRKAKEHAEESDRLKTSFLQNMSHEIRTPMNAIMGFASLMPSNFDDKQKLEYFSSIIETRCADLLDIINDLLDISRIESGQSTVNNEVFNLHELVQELSSFFNDYKIRFKKQEISFKISAQLNDRIASVKTDKLKLKQILTNLIANAIKFTEKGTIECGYSVEGNKLLFYVKDTGVGIPADKHDFIFERFTQLNHPSLQNVGGTGLGLTIVKGLVDILGGKIWLESENNKGTTFYFTVTYEYAETLNRDSYDNKCIKELTTEKTILIVEDDLLNAEYLNEIVKDVSSKIITVRNGLSAIEIVKEQKIDFVLLDIGLPDISGYEVSRILLEINPQVKIIAQTAYAAYADKKQAIAAGCVDYISKPIMQNDLMAKMTNYL